MSVVKRKKSRSKLQCHSMCHIRTRDRISGQEDNENVVKSYNCELLCPQGGIPGTSMLSWFYGFRSVHELLPRKVDWDTWKTYRANRWLTRLADGATKCGIFLIIHVNSIISSRPISGSLALRRRPMRRPQCKASTTRDPNLGNGLYLLPLSLVLLLLLGVKHCEPRDI